MPARLDIPAKFIGDRGLVERCVVTLAGARALMLVGEPGTAKSMLSELLSAAICGSSELTVQGSAGTTEDQLRYGWNYALLLAEGPSARALVPSPVLQAMRGGRIARIEEVTRCLPEVQDALVPMLSERRLAIPELGEYSVAAAPLVQCDRHREPPGQRGLGDVGGTQTSIQFRVHFPDHLPGGGDRAGPDPVAWSCRWEPGWSTAPSYPPPASSDLPVCSRCWCRRLRRRCCSGKAASLPWAGSAKCAGGGVDKHPRTAGEPAAGHRTAHRGADPAALAGKDRHTGHPGRPDRRCAARVSGHPT
ncbi:ATP-binding protein [Corynebacterium sp. A21]|uniref:ATP-binding protein n=1 Tax=Corynebacterium sp. A21 TaxID=3457318 RepID=UPI003FD445CE